MPLFYHAKNFHAVRENLSDLSTLQTITLYLSSNNLVRVSQVGGGGFMSLSHFAHSRGQRRCLPNPHTYRF